MKRQASVHPGFPAADVRSLVASCFCSCLCLPQHDGLHPQIVSQCKLSLKLLWSCTCLGNMESICTLSILLTPLSPALSVPAARKPLCLVESPLIHLLYPLLGHLLVSLGSTATLTPWPACCLLPPQGPGLVSLCDLAVLLLTHFPWMLTIVQ